MTKTTYSCDFCGADVTNTISHKLTMRRTGQIGSETKDYDVCNPCQSKLDQLLEKKVWKS
jgi:hypothetical protein